MNQKVEALRATFKKLGVQGYLFSTSDAFQSEFTPPCARYVKYISNFSGSFGFCLILEKKAALFVDGRYDVQAKQEVDLDIFQVFLYTPNTFQKFIEDSCSNQSVIGIDPWLLTWQNVLFFQELFPSYVKLQSLEKNPIDTIWKSKPPAIAYPVYEYSLEYAGQAVEKKIQSLAANIPNKGFYWLGSPEAICWLLNIRGKDFDFSPVFTVFGFLSQNKDLAIFCDPKHIQGAVRKTVEQYATLYTYQDFFSFLTGKAAEQHTLYGSRSRIPYKIIEMYQELGGSVKPYKEICAEKRALKNITEIEKAKEAHKEDALALVQFMSTLEEGFSDHTEWTAAQLLTSFREKQPHYQGKSFEVIAGYGPNGAKPHYLPTEHTAVKLEEGGLFLIDSGGQYWGGTTDVTRTLYMGDASPKVLYKQWYTKVLKGHIALSMTIFPHGTTGHQLDAFARRWIWASAADFLHSTGHGVGSFLNVHESPPTISSRPISSILEPGMIVSNEPAYYEENQFGIRIENLVHVVEYAIGKKGQSFYTFQDLTLVPYEQKLIDKSMLSTEEITWINEYHANVFDALSPHLDKKTQEWLRCKTYPI